MSRLIPIKELQLIEQTIAEHPTGIGISALEQALKNLLPKMNRRTLQRRLKRLIENGQIYTEGESIALVYKKSSIAIDPNSTVDKTSSDIVIEEFDVPLSKEGGIIQKLVRKPLMKRKPVGYQRTFLEEYEPGTTFYLPKTLRTQFHEIGHTTSIGRPAGTYARDIFNRLLIDLSWASSRLEGNTYNRLDTQNLIEFGHAAEGKDILETQMILNHKAAIEMLIEEIDQIGFNLFTFLNLHSILAENLLSDEDACGRLRRRPVEISGSVYHPPAMPQVLEDCFRLLLQKAADIPDPFEQAFFVMVQLPYLQPFEDVNKRVSRLAANIPLFLYNLCPILFIDVPEKAYVDGILGVYELNQIDLLRDVFIWAYERSCQRYLAITQNIAEPDPMRIRYRDALIQAVQTIVGNGQPPSKKKIQQLTNELATKDDRTAFNKMLINALQNLHEGCVARYRIKLSEFQTWKPIRDRHKVQS